MSPTAHFSSLAMAVPITTSRAPSAKRPSVSRNGLTLSRSFAFGSSPDAKYGPPPSTLPSRPTMRASSEMLPTAEPTPGTARTSAILLSAMLGFAL